MTYEDNIAIHTIGIIIHSDCLYSGHGPGVTTIFSCTKGEFVPVLDKKANIADVMNIGTKRKKR